MTKTGDLVPSRALHSLAFAVLAAFTFAVSPSFAQTGSSERAAALFEEGRKAAEAGDYTTAREKLTESQRVEPAVGTLMNLADVEGHEGRLLEALARWNEAMALAQKTNDVRVEFIQGKIDRLQPRIPSLTIEVAGGLPEGTRISRNGDEVPLDTVGTAVQVNPGRYVITAKAPGRPEQRAEVFLEEGQREVARLTFREAGPPEVAASNKIPERKAAAPDHTLAYVLGGVGVAGVVVGAVTGLMLRSKQSTIDEHCDSSTKACDDQAGPDAAESAKGLVPINVVAWTVGIVGLGSGTIVYLSGRSAREESVAGVAVGGRF